MRNNEKKLYTDIDIFGKTIIYYAFKIGTIIFGLFIAIGIIVLESLAVFSRESIYIRIACIMSMAYGLLMILSILIFYFLIERVNDSVLLYFLNKKEIINDFYLGYFKYSFNSARRTINLSEKVQRIEEIIYVDDNGKRIICEELIDKKLREIVYRLNENENSLETLKNDYKDYRKIEEVKKYNERIWAKIKLSNTSINFLALKIIFFIAMTVSMVRNCFIPSEYMNIIERNIYNISAIVLLGIDILENIIDKLSPKNIE